MKKLFLIVLFLLTLSGCSIFRVHKMDIQQGNIITQQQVDQLHAGMSENDVRRVMGNPVLINVFTPNRVEYIYTFQAGYGAMEKRNVTCLFENGTLRKVIQR